VNLKFIKSIKIPLVFFLIFFKTVSYFSQSSRTSSFGSLKKDTVIFQNKMGIKDNLVEDESFTQNNIDRYPVTNIYSDYENWLSENKIQNKFGTMNIIGDVSKFLIVKKLKNLSGTDLTLIEKTKLSSGLSVETPAWEGSTGTTLMTEGLVNTRSIFTRNLFESFSSSITINEDNIGAYLGFDAAFNPYFGTTLNITSNSPNKINIAEKLIIGPTCVLVGTTTASSGLPNNSLEVIGNIRATKIYGFYGFSAAIVNLSPPAFIWPLDANINNYVINGTSSPLTSGTVVGSGAMRGRTYGTPTKVAELAFTYKSGCSLAIFSCFELFSIYESIFYSTQIVITNTSDVMMGSLQSQVNTHQFEDHNWYDEGYDFTLINQLAYDPAATATLVDGTAYKVILYAWVSAVEKVSGTRSTFKSETSYTNQCKPFFSFGSFQQQFTSIAIFGLPTQ